MKLEHIAVNISDPQAAATWYAEHLGLRIVKESDTAPFVYFLADDEGSMLEFYIDSAGDLPDYAAMSPFTLHLAFTVQDIEAAFEKLLVAGATAAGKLIHMPAGDQIVFLRDPWGLTLQLVRRHTPL